MRRNGNEVGIDAGFTIDPDDCGHDNVVERDGYRVCGCAGFLGIEVTVPPNNAENIPPGDYSQPYDSWRESPDDDSDDEETRAHYQTLANVIEALQDGGWRPSRRDRVSA